jgi:hypothetical protein
MRRSAERLLTAQPRATNIEPAVGQGTFAFSIEPVALIGCSLRLTFQKKIQLDGKAWVKPHIRLINEGWTSSSPFQGISKAVSK